MRTSSGGRSGFAKTLRRDKAPELQALRTRLRPKAVVPALCRRNRGFSWAHFLFAIVRPGWGDYSKACADYISSHSTQTIAPRCSQLMLFTPLFRAFCEHGAEHGVSVGRYVIMPDHMHLFIAMPESGLSLAHWIKALRSALGKVLLAQGYAKPHWQEGFFDHVLRSDESYGEKWNYVRMNPVRAGLVEHPDQWPYEGEIQQLRY